MKRLYAVAAIATTFLAFSCQKNMGTGSGEPQEPSSAVPADFKWETTRDLDISVGMPSVTGNTPQYAVIRVYCSPILSDGNIVAMGVVTPSRPVFGTAVTIPAGIGNIYVQTTLPDGTVAVSMEPVAASVNVAGARMKAAAGTPLLRMAGMARGSRRRPRVISPRGPSSGVRLPARSTWVRAGLLLPLRSIISRQEPRLRAISA
mgnify:CR=1 FL=1